MIFISKYLGYKQWIKPAYYKRDELGQRVYVAGQFVKFQDGRVEIDDDDQDTINALLSNKEYGFDFWAIDEDGNTIERDNIAGKAAHKKEESDMKTAAAKACPFCEFNAKNDMGLTFHIKAKHPEKVA